MASKVMTDLALRLSANTADLKKGLTEANKNVNKFRKDTKSSNDKMAGAFKAVGAAVAGAIL